ncbi:MAG: cellulose binding domain-containing protein [Thiolinea sp.]
MKNQLCLRLNTAQIAKTMRYWLIGLVVWFFSSVAWAGTACKVDYTIPNQWGNGFSANVSLTNTGEAWSSWTVTWDMPNGQKITGLWNGNSTQTGAAVMVKNASWNANVGSNATVQFGFNGSHTGTNQKPSNIAVNGVLCEGNPPPPKPAVVACEVKYAIVTEWDTGYTGDVAIKNTGDALSAWTVAWDMPDAQQLTGMWNGVYKQTSSHVDVTHAGWNQLIAAGGMLQFGFNANHSGLNRIPGNISVNGVKCTGQIDPPVPPPLPVK